MNAYNLFCGARTVLTYPSKILILRNFIGSSMPDAEASCSTNSG